MKLARIFLSLLVFTFPLFTFAQDSADEAAKKKLENEKALLEQILTDAKHLKLPENRAFVYARIGNALWQSDEKRARGLFQIAVNELIAAQSEPFPAKDIHKFHNLIYGQYPRWEILFLLANRDADLALDALTKTRPPKLSQAVAALSNEYVSQPQYYARSEVQNEQRLLAICAEKSPERAIKLVRESLKKEVSYETINLLNKIHQKDAETATKLAEEAAQLFLDADFGGDSYQKYENLAYFLNVVGREKSADENNSSFRISERLVRDLADKLSSLWLKPETKAMYGYHNAHFVVERFFPDRAARVKQRFEQVTNQNEHPQQKEYNKLLQSEATAETLVSQAAKFPPSWRNEIYRNAAERLSKSGNIAGAQKLLTDNLPDEEVDGYLSQFNYNLASQAISQGKFEEALMYINQIPNESQRINYLTYLASSIFQKDPKENQKWAISVLEQANSLLPETPEAHEDIAAALNIASVYTNIEPALAFSRIESLITTLNELSQANAVMNKFRNYGYFRHGEFQIGSQNSFGVGGFENILRTLKSKDFDRALQISNSFQRLDTRISIQIFLVDEINQLTNLPINNIRSGGFYVISGNSR